MRCRSHIYTTIIFIVFLSLSACGGGGLANIAGGGSDSTTTDLYESGPVEIPVTIAKLDAPDSSKIIVAVEPIGDLAISPDITPNPDGVEIIDDCTLIYTVTGLAGAISDDDATHAYILNYTLDVYLITAVASDGSFEGQICGRYQDQVVVTALDSSSLAAANSSSPLIITVDENDDNQITVIITDTNAGEIKTNFNVLTDSSGNAYYVIVNDDDTSDFYRRNVDGRALEIIWQGESDIPTALGSYSDSLVIYFNQNGTLKQVTIPDSSASISNSFLTGKGTPQLTLFSTISSVGDYDIGLNPNTHEGFRIDAIYDVENDNPGFFVIMFPDDGNLPGISGAVFSDTGETSLGDSFADLDSKGGSSAIGDFQNGRGYFVVIDEDTDGCGGNGCLAGQDLNGSAFVLEDSVHMYALQDSIVQVDTNPADYNAAILLGENGVYYFHQVQNFFGMGAIDTQLTPAYSFSEVDENDDGVDDNYATHMMTLDTSGDIKKIAWSKRGLHLLGCKLYSDGKYSLVCYNADTSSWDDIVPEDMRTESDDNFCVPTADITTTTEDNIHIWWPRQHSIIYEDENEALQDCYLSDYYDWINDDSGTDSESRTATEIVFNFCTTYSGSDSFSNWDDHCDCYGPFADSTDATCSGSWENSCTSANRDDDLSDCVEYLSDEVIAPVGAGE